MSLSVSSISATVPYPAFARNTAKECISVIVCVGVCGRVGVWVCECVFGKRLRLRVCPSTEKILWYHVPEKSMTPLHIMCREQIAHRKHIPHREEGTETSIHLENTFQIQKVTEESPLRKHISHSKGTRGINNAILVWYLFKKTRYQRHQSRHSRLHQSSKKSS